MLTPLVIMVREGFEAALIVAIVFAYLRRIDRLDLSKYAWGGVAAAVALASVAGVVIHLTVGALEGLPRLRAFAAISVIAAIVLTWMVFWMRRQARAIKGELEHKVDDAVGHGDARRAIVAVAFFSVLREGIEAALFLVASATTAEGGTVVAGAVIGLVIAAVLGWAVYAGGRRMPMRAFFRVTGIVVVVFAAGLLAKSVLFLQASGDLRTMHDNVYDLTRFAWLTQRTEVGRTLAALIGWDPRPSIEQVLAWVGYFIPVTWLFLRSPASAQPAAPAGASTSDAGTTAGSNGATAAEGDRVTIER
ncbi:MAG: high-affinity iron transporter [Acidimicrobiaceae bacterium]|jgi:high-affinity iron transporter|nr:high-affinity iron transporter [Acidimicrobiaceae bacterium]